MTRAFILGVFLVLQSTFRNSTLGVGCSLWWRKDLFKDSYPGFYTQNNMTFILE